MFDLELANWEFLLLWGLVPLAYWMLTRSTSIIGFSSVSVFRNSSKTIKQWLSHLPPLMICLGIAFVVFALARPRTPQSQSRVSKEGIAIMMVVDLSSSMDARDLIEEDRSINRLAVVKDVFVDFIFGRDKNSGKGRLDDLVGLVTFAGYADSVCPLTLDHGNLANIVKDLSIVNVRSEDGTAIGDGLGLSVERLRKSSAKSRVAILLTDGVSNAGVIEPLKAAELAAQNDIKVYCIGVGTNGMAPMPGRGLFGGRQLVSVPVQIDEETLTQISEKTGGKYFRAVDAEALAKIYGEIDSLERTKVSEVRYLQYTEHFRIFVLIGVGLIAFATLLRGSFFRKSP